MIKVHILTRCEYCGGDAYLPECEATSYTGETYTRYAPCPLCQGTGNQARWVDLREFADLLDKAAALEPDYLELASHVPVTQYQDSHDAAGI